LALARAAGDAMASGDAMSQPLLADEGKGLAANGSSASLLDPEVLQPRFHSTKRQSSVRTSIYNLVSTIIGGGILSLPYAFDRAGILGALIMLVASAAASDFTTWVLICCGRRTGATSYEGVATAAFGMHAKALTQMLVVMLTTIASVAYAILLRDLAGSIVRGFIVKGGTTLWTENAIMAMLVVAVSPFCLLRTLNALRFLSFFSICAVAALAVVVIFHTAECHADDDINEEITLWPDSIGNFLDAMPIFICCFVCHFNVLPTHGELRRPTRARLHRVVHGTMLVTGVFYIIVGLSGYLYMTCEGKFEDNVLNAFPDDDAAAAVGRCGLGITVLLSFPLLIVPCRDTLLGMVLAPPAPFSLEEAYNPVVTATLANSFTGPSPGPGDMEGAANGEAGADDSNMPLYADDVLLVRASRGGIPQDLREDLDAEETEDEAEVTESSGSFQADRAMYQSREMSTTGPLQPQASDVVIRGTTFGLLGLVMSVAFFIHSVSAVWGIAGSTVCIGISFSIPCWAYVRIRANAPKAWRRRLLAWAILFISTICAIVCTTNAIMGYMK